MAENVYSLQRMKQDTIETGRRIANGELRLVASRPANEVEPYETLNTESN